MPPAKGRVCVQCNLSQCFIKRIWIISNHPDQFVGLQMTSALSLLGGEPWPSGWFPASQELARGLQVEMLSHGLAQGCLSLESSCHHQQLLLLLLCLHIHVCTWSCLNPPMGHQESQLSGDRWGFSQQPLPQDSWGNCFFAFILVAVRASHGAPSHCQQNKPQRRHERDDLVSREKSHFVRAPVGLPTSWVTQQSQGLVTEFTSASTKGWLSLNQTW